MLPRLQEVVLSYFKADSLESEDLARLAEYDLFKSTSSKVH